MEIALRGLFAPPVAAMGLRDPQARSIAFNPGL
jgi:hypothetical protein